MDRRRRREAEASSEGTGFIERILGALLGAASGAVIYLVVHVLAFRPMHGPDRWSLEGPFKWYIVAGALLGLLFGLSFARWLWSYVTDELHFEASAWGAVLVVVVVAIAILALAIKFANAA